MAESDRLAGTAEEEPLLGERGDASQREGKPLYYNFLLGELHRNALVLYWAEQRDRNWCCRPVWSMDRKPIHETYAIDIY